MPQHAWSAPPQVPHTLPDAITTQEPLVHWVAAAQQGSPSPPQVEQVPALPSATERPVQPRPVSQVPVAPVPQHASPEPPQVSVHTLPEAPRAQERPLPQVPPPKPPGQQGCPEAPQALHVPVSLPFSVMQPRPLWQLLPPQQAAPLAPQLSQVPVEPHPFGASQPRPALQALLAQQGSPELPQRAQVRAPSSVEVHASESWQGLVPKPGQHSAPAVPQAMHVPFEHPLPEAEQNSFAGPNPASVPVPQQAWPTLPQGSPVLVLVHEPAEQVPLTPVAVQASPAPTQVRVVGPPPPAASGMQHPSALHTLPAQQGSPGSPQLVEVPPLPPAADVFPPPAPPDAWIPPAPAAPPLPLPPVVLPPDAWPPLPPAPLELELLLQPTNSSAANPAAAIVAIVKEWCGFLLRPTAF